MPGEGFQGPKCGARTRQGVPCQQPAVRGGVRCRMHGGKARKGIAHPNYRHGKHSEYMPTRFLEAFGLAASDRDLLQQRDEVAQVRSMIREAWKRRHTGESGELWKRLRERWREFDGANRAASELGISPEERAARMRRVTLLLDMLMETIRVGAHDREQEEEILDLLERQRRLIESQGKREVQEKMMVSLEDANATFRAIAEAVRAEVQDQAVVARIAHRFAEISGKASPLEPYDLEPHEN